MNHHQIDQLAHQSAFGTDMEKQRARDAIYQACIDAQIYPWSINDLYKYIGSQNNPPKFSVPAMNLRGMSYDTSTTLFTVAKHRKVGALICELARSEMAYTDQPPSEYAHTIMAGALKAGWSGALFIQCDHFTVKTDEQGNIKSGEFENLKNLITEAIHSGFYNVDIDMSTLVDLSQKTHDDQQAGNVENTLKMIEYVRSIQPKELSISLGGEIGHIGGINSTVDDFEVFMTGLNKGLNGMEGIYKVAIQTGSSHGGVVLADGSLSNVKIDFSILKSIAKVGREKYQIGGPVQHGASTLPETYFSKFLKNEAIEVHLATGFQNTQMDHPAFPKEILDNMHVWMAEELSRERKVDMTEQQFIYSLRKKAWGKFKNQTWEMPEANRNAINQTMGEKFDFLFKQLNVYETSDFVTQIVKPSPISRITNKSKLSVSNENASDLAD